MQAIVKTVQESMARAYKTLEKSKKASKKREDALIDRFLDEVYRQSKDSDPTNAYDYDLIDDLTDSIAGLSLNKIISNVIKKTIHAVKKSSAQHKCSKCGRAGHNSHKCPRKKKSKSKSKSKSKKSKVNLATLDSDSGSNSDTDSDINSSDNSSGSRSDFDDAESDSDSSSTSNHSLNIHIAKAKKK